MIKKDVQKIIYLQKRKQKIIDDLKFSTKYWVEINDDSCGTYDTNSQIKFKNSRLKPSLCDYGDAYILVKGNITVQNTAAAGAEAKIIGRKIIFKNCAPLTDCISEINNTQHN